MSLNKPATESSVSARWYLWDGGFLAIGKSNWGVIPPHSHHAIQIVVAIEGEMAIKGARGDWRSGRGVIVRHDVEHSYDGKGAMGAMIFVDPESFEGGWLQTALTEDITVVPEARTSIVHGSAENVPGAALREYGDRRPDSTLRARAVPGRAAVAAPRRARDEGADEDPGVGRLTDVD